MKGKIGAYIESARPFTLLAPAIGILGGGLMALGSLGLASERGLWIQLLLGALAAALLNVTSNTVNQYFDRDIDAVNKPERPLPSGRVSGKELLGFGLICALGALALAAKIGFETFLLFFAAGFFTIIYSAPPLRLKRFAWIANIDIAIPRGVLLPVAGWSTVAGISQLDPWLVGGVIGLFLIGAASTKDFSDIEGDRMGGCNTIPIRYGVKRAALLITPFFAIPWLGLPVMSAFGLLGARPYTMIILGGVLCLWGAFTAFLILKDPEKLAGKENHPSWRHMYLMIVFASIGSGIAYLI